MRNLAVIVLAFLAQFALASPAPAANGNFHEHFVRQALPHNDGWAASGAGTTGGSAAASITTVQTRDELAAAVAGDAPKIVLVKGTIEGPSCAGLADPAYSLEAFLATYDPAVW